MQTVTKSKSQISAPLFVAISDIHFNLNNLELSSHALKAALNRAEQLRVPLVIAGDLNDTKAIIRAEVANKIIGILSPKQTPVYILVGNHDLINEKGEAHGLHYLSPYAIIVDHVISWPNRRVVLIPYQTDVDMLKLILEGTNPNSIVVMHQGVMGAAMGDYVVDKSSIDPALLENFTCISGHYHRHQTIGTLTYIGSPFTMSFGEANDGPKGFLVVNQDGSFTREILDLRKHIIFDVSTQDLLHGALALCDPQDLIWVKVRGPQSELAQLKREHLARVLGNSNFKLDKIGTDNVPIESIGTKPLTGEEILDKLVDNTDESKEQKKYLKKLWRESIC